MKNIVTANARPEVRSLNNKLDIAIQPRTLKSICITLAISLIMLLLSKYASTAIVVSSMGILILLYIVKIIKGILQVNIVIDNFNLSEDDIEKDLWY